MLVSKLWEHSCIYDMMQAVEISQKGGVKQLFCDIHVFCSACCHHNGQDCIASCAVITDLTQLPRCRCPKNKQCVVGGFLSETAPKTTNIRQQHIVLCWRHRYLIFFAENFKCPALGPQILKKKTVPWLTFNEQRLVPIIFLLYYFSLLVVGSLFYCCFGQYCS
jgi:hypothetical protein